MTKKWVGGWEKTKLKNAATIQKKFLVAFSTIEIWHSSFLSS
jgi:hypothetical protein